MDPADGDLEALSAQLRGCLGRIDADLARLLADASDPDEAPIEAHASELQDLVDELVRRHAVPAPSADLPATVTRAVRTLLQEVGFPLVVRTLLPAGLPRAACRPPELQHAVQRALALAAAQAGSGGEITVAAAMAEDAVHLDVHSSGPASPHLRERALTLQAFVAGWQGRCEIRSGTAGWSLRLEIPVALEPGRS